MLLYPLQNLFLPPHQSSWIREVDVIQTFGGLRQILKFFVLIVLLVLILIKKAVNESFIDLNDITCVRVLQIDMRLVVIKTIELLQELKVTSVLRKLLE